MISVHRQVFATVPVTVEYSLTDKGEEFLRVYYTMHDCGERWKGYYITDVMIKECARSVVTMQAKFKRPKSKCNIGTRAVKDFCKLLLLRIQELYSIDRLLFMPSQIIFASRIEGISLALM